MSLLKKSKKVTIDGKEYIMAFDMRSVAIFQEISGESFTNAMPKLFAGVDFILLCFMGSTLRPITNIDSPIAGDIFNSNKFDMLGLLLNQGKEVTSLIAQSLPKVEGKK